MKIVLIISFLLTILFSHSQTPIVFGGKDKKLDTLSTKQVKTVAISIQNLNSYEQQYYIEVDNKYIGLTQKLRHNQVIKLNVPVKINKANKLEIHNICTVSVPRNEEELFKTKICTKAYLYWLKE